MWEALEGLKFMAWYCQVHYNPKWPSLREWHVRENWYLSRVTRFWYPLWFSFKPPLALFGVEDRVQITKETRLTNLLLSSSFCIFILYWFMSAVSSTPSRSQNLWRDHPFYKILKLLTLKTALTWLACKVFSLLSCALTFDSDANRFKNSM